MGKKIIFLLIFCVLLFNHVFGSDSERILKFHDRIRAIELDSSSISYPFTPQVRIETSVLLNQQGDNYSMFIFASDTVRHKIFCLDVSDGLDGVSGIFGEYGMGDGQFIMPTSIAADKYGNVFVVDSDTSLNRIVKLNINYQTGAMTFVQNIYSNFFEPYDVVIDTNLTSDANDDRIWVSDAANCRIVELDFNGNLLREFGSAGDGVMEFCRPTNLAIYERNAGNIVKICVGDEGNSRLVNMSTDGDWFTIPVWENDPIIGISVYEGEIFLLQKISGIVQKYRWPDVFLSTFSRDDENSVSQDPFYLPNSMCIPFPEIPYIFIMEQFMGEEGCRTSLQGIDVKDLNSQGNVDGSAALFEYSLLTNSIITEKIVDDDGNTIKILSDSLLMPSNPEYFATWYGDNELGEQVPGGTYYYEISAKTNWEFSESGQPLGKRIINSIITSSPSSGEPGDTLLKKVRLDLPITLTVTANNQNCMDNELIWDSEVSSTSINNYGSNEYLRIGSVDVQYRSNYNVHRPTIKFDLSNTSLDKFDIVKDASIMLRLSNVWNSGVQRLNIHRILIPWNEMNSSWNHSGITDEHWNGCETFDYFASKEPVGYLEASTGTGWYEWYGPEITNMVQDWLTNPASNHGILIKLEDDKKNETHLFKFFSSEHSDSTLTPKLEIVYEKDVFKPAFNSEIVVNKLCGSPPLSVYFDASNSYSVSGIRTYGWNFNLDDENDTNFLFDTTGQVITHTFENIGEYIIGLCIEDSATIKGYDYIIIKVLGDSLFADTFNDTLSDGWVAKDMNHWDVDIDEGTPAYYINTTDLGYQYDEQCAEYALIQKQRFSDFCLTARARAKVDEVGLYTCYAVIFGYQDANNYYYMRYQNLYGDHTVTHGSALWKVENGTATKIKPATGGYLVTDNDYHDVKVTRQGDNIAAYFDDAMVMYYQDDTFGSGKIGVGTLATPASFDDIDIFLRDPNQPAFSTDTTFFDNFEDGDAMSWTPLNFGNWSIGDQGGSNAYYINDSNHPDLEYSLVNSSQYEDFIFTCKAKTLEATIEWGTDFCIFFGYQDDQNFYKLLVNHDYHSVGLYKHVNGNVESIALPQSGCVNDNNFHDIKIRRSGDEIKYWWDNSLKFTVTDTTFGKGAIGVGSINDAAAFDYVTIYPWDSIPPPPTVDFYEEDFESFTDTEWEPLTASRWSIGTEGTNHYYYINTSNFTNPTDRVGEYSLVKDKLFSDFRFQTDVKTLESSIDLYTDYHFLFGYQDPDNYYYLQFCNRWDLTKLFKLANGTKTLIGTRGLTFVDDHDWHHVDIRRINEDIIVYFDDFAHIIAQDTTFITGKIGIGAKNDMCAFDNVHISNDSLLIPTPSLQEDFSQSNYNWKIVDDGTTSAPSYWQFYNGEYRQTTNIYTAGGNGYDNLGTYAYWQSRDTKYWDDYIFETTIRSTDDDCIGVMFYYLDGDNYYRLELFKQANKRRLAKKVDGTFHLLASEDAGYVQGQNQTLRVEILYGEILCKLDGSNLFGGAIVDTTLKSGSVALYSYLNAGSYFDNVVVEKHPLAKNAKEGEEIVRMPTTFKLSQNFPNPFNPTTTIQYQLPERSDLTITVYNIMGRKVKTLVDSKKEPGYYEYVWDGMNQYNQKIASGIYIYRMVAKGKSKRYHKVKKMLFLK